MTQEELNEQMIKAVDNRDTKTVRKMLEQGADPNVQDNSGYTALTYACRNGEPEMIQMLLDAKVDPNVQDKYGYTALMYACRDRDTDTATVRKTVRKILEHGADPNVQDNSGETALTTACSNPRGNRDVITALITAGAELDKRNNNSMTALMCLARGGYTGLMKLLIKAGADAATKDDRGRTALDILQDLHPDKYDRWIQNTIVQSRKQTLKREDSAQSRGHEPDFDI